MMYKPTDILRGRPWLLLCLLFAWLLPQEAAAERYVEKTCQYMVMLNGANTVRIKAPVYDEDRDDHWVCNGNLYVTWTDDNGTTHKKSLLHFGFNYGDTGRGSGPKQDSHDNDDSTLPVFFGTEVGGSLDITQGNSTNHFTLKQEDGEQTHTIYENNDGKTYEFSAVWRVPYDMLGKHLKFEWGIMLDYTNGLTYDTDYSLSGLNPTEIDVPKVQDVMTPQLIQATMSYSNAGMLEIPWFMATDKMTNAHYEYTDQFGKTQKVDLQPKATSDIIYLDATVPHKNFRIVVSYKDNLDNLIENISSQAMDLPVIHAPQGLTVRSLGDMKSKMELKWNISHSDVSDLTYTDQFVIQRSLTGQEADFEDIGNEMYAQGVTSDSTYIFIDSTLVQAIAEAHLKSGGTLDHLTYRVRRAMTENWGWEKNNCADKASTVVDDLHLLRIANYTAKWEDERAYTVRVSWDYADEPGAVWDNRAQMVLHVVMKNRDSQSVDTTRYVLTNTERQQRYKVVSFYRPCVNFDVDIFVERNESPINYLEDVATFFFPIRNAADWTVFCKFDGSLEGDNCHSNGGFIGWSERNCNIIIKNSLFAPDHITTSYTDCETWSRKRDVATVTLINSYATKDYTQGNGTSGNPYRIYSIRDWNMFVNAVKDAKGESDVNARLCADITTSEYAGEGEATHFRGTFDGNGHNPVQQYVFDRSRGSTCR